MRFWLLLVLALAACKAERARPNHASSSRSKARTGHLGGLPTSPKGGGSKARPALVVRKATVVAFWLPGADTLDEGDASDALEDLRAGSGHLAGYLKDQEIVVVGSVSDSIWVEAANGPRRLVMLVGLDYPYGYVLIDPGYPEQIITGESSDEELQDAADDYFGLDGEDPGRDRVQVRRRELRRGGRAEQVAHLLRQCDGGERLLEKGRTGTQDPMAGDRLLGVAGDE
jgi:hypothetical protein